MVSFTTVACIISSRLKRYKNYKNRLRLAEVILKNKLPRFFLVHCVYMHIVYMHILLFFWHRYHLPPNNVEPEILMKLRVFAHPVAMLSVNETQIWTRGMKL